MTEPMQVSIHLPADYGAKPGVLLGDVEIIDHLIGFNISASQQGRTLTLELGNVDIQFTGAGIDVTAIHNVSEAVGILEKINMQEFEDEALAGLGMGDKLVPILIQKIIERLEQ